DLGSIYDRNRTLFRGVTLRPDASLGLPDGDGQFVLFDFYGNPLPARDGRITIPLNGLGFYLRTTGAAGSFARLIDAVKTARIDGYEPVDVEVSDFTAPVTQKPGVRVKLTNVLNRRIRGQLTLTGPLMAASGTVIESLELAPHETRVLRVETARHEPREDNQYPVQIRFEAGPDGVAEHAETLRVNFISRRSIAVDGELGDWQGTLPQPVGGEGLRANLTEAAWLPFKNYDASVKSGITVGFMAADDDWFYFAAKVADDTPWGGGPRYETRDDDRYFYPEKVFSKAKDGRQELLWPEGVRRFTYRRDFEIPSGNGTDNLQIAFNVLPENQKGLYSHPAGTMPRYMVYADTDYEFALNPVAEQFGGGTEIWCLQRPGMVRKHFFPRQPKAAVDGGPVKDGRLVIRRDGNTRVVECAIPWSSIPEVKARRDAGQPVKFSFRVNDNRGPAHELAAGRSVSKDNPFAFHNDWATHWANELEFGWE
ncbi:MAG: DOMON domain-containing protein, partial [Limisphaerales bacterium]